MNKILCLLPLFFALLVSACSSDDEPQVPKLNISKNEVNIHYEDVTEIVVSGINSEEYSVSCEDEYIATVATSGEKIKISAKHIGTTKVIVKYKDQKKECTVTIEPWFNSIGNPILEFGASKEEIRSKLNGTIMREDDDKIYIAEDYSYHSIYVYYYFKNNKLECVCSEIYLALKPDYTDRTLRSLQERYDFLYEDSRGNWFSYRDEFIVREIEYGGYAILYAKDKETISPYCEIY